MVAGTAREETMIQAFKDGLDIHNFNASKIFNIPIEEVNKNQRKIAKGVSFGILYGSTVKALALNYFKGDVEKAQKLLDDFFTNFPKLKEFIDAKHKEAKEFGYVTNYTNRILYLEPVYRKDRVTGKSTGEVDEGSRDRRAQNVPIQGGSEDVAGWIDYNIAMHLLGEDDVTEEDIKEAKEYGVTINKKPMLSKTSMFIHDSFEIDIFPTELFDMVKYCDWLINVRTPRYWDIPMSSDVVVGPSIGQEIEVSTIPLKDILTNKEDEKCIELKTALVEQGIMNDIIATDSDVTKWNYIKLDCPASGPGTLEDVNEMVYGIPENPNGWITAYKKVIEINRDKNAEKDQEEYISWKLLMQGSHAPLKSNFGGTVHKGVREYIILNELKDDYWAGYEEN